MIKFVDNGFFTPISWGKKIVQFNNLVMNMFAGQDVDILHSNFANVVIFTTVIIKHVNMENEYCGFRINTKIVKTKTCNASLETLEKFKNLECV